MEEMKCPGTCISILWTNRQQGQRSSRENEVKIPMRPGITEHTFSSTMFMWRSKALMRARSFLLFLKFYHKGTVRSENATDF